MTNPPNLPNHTDSGVSGQPLRRPGWGLIQDVRPTRSTRPKPSTMDPKPPESRPRPATTPIQNPTPIPTPDRRLKFKLWTWLGRYGLVLAAPLVVVVSIRLSSLPLVGDGIIAAYAGLALVRRLPSRLSFWLATIVLIGTAIEFLWLPGADRSNNSALFAFLLLGVGLVCQVRETHRLSRRQRRPTVDNTSANKIAKGEG